MYRIIALLALTAISAQAQSFHWELTNGPGTTGPGFLAITPTNDIIAGESNTIVRSTDHGKSWIPYAPITFGKVIEASVLPDGRFLILCDNGSIVRYYLDGRSNVVLQVSVSGLPYTNCLEADRDGNVYTLSFAQSRTLLLRSKNSGDTWDTIKTPNSEDITYFTADGQRYYLSTATGIFTSTDMGTNWKRCLNGLITDRYRFVVAGHNGVVYGCKGVITKSWTRSTDYGQTWEGIAINGDETTRAVLDKSNNAILYGGKEIMFVTKDTSIQIDEQIFGTHPSAALDSSAGLFASVNDNGSGNLFYANANLPLVWHTRIAPFSRPGFIFTGFSTVVAGSGNYNWTYDASAGWLPQSGNSAIPIGMNYYQSCLLGTSTNGGLSTSKDSGRSWQNIFPAIPAGPVFAAAVNARTIYAASKGIYKTTDSAKNWTETNDNLITPITAMCADSNGVVYVASNQELFMTTDGGNSWPKTVQQALISVRYLVSNKAGTVALAGNGDVVTRLSNLGKNSENVNIPGNLIATGLVLLPNGDVFCSTRQNVYYWPTGSSKVYDASSGLFGHAILSLTSDLTGSLYVSTDGNGVYKSVGKPELLSVPSQAASERATIYPNPAATAVTIAIPHAGRWSVTASDVLGRERLLESKSQGDNAITVEVKDLPIGLYTLSLTCENETVTSKVNIVR